MAISPPARIAVLVPCDNKGISIGRVIADFHRTPPEAKVFVYDNNSTDDTRQRAIEAGAFLGSERLQGKAYVARRMLAEFEADIYVQIDGDASYGEDAAPAMVELLQRDGLDMVVGTRIIEETAAYRQDHCLDSLLLTGQKSRLFGHSSSDILPGHRVPYRWFLQSYPPLAGRG